MDEPIAKSPSKLMRRLAQFGFAVTAAGLSLGVWICCMRSTPFSGDGQLSDSGFWSYPRYTVLFPQIEFQRKTHHAFAVKPTFR